MRTECLARFQNIAREPNTSAKLTAFRDVGLNHAEHIFREGFLESLDARNVLASGDRRCRARAQPVPFLPWPVGADRLLRKAQIELSKPRHHLQRLGDRSAP